MNTLAALRSIRAARPDGAPDSAEHAGLAVEVERLGNVRPGKPHETFPEVPVRFVPCLDYRHVSAQATDIQRQRRVRRRSHEA